MPTTLPCVSRPRTRATHWFGAFARRRERIASMGRSGSSGRISFVIRWNNRAIAICSDSGRSRGSALSRVYPFTSMPRSLCIRPGRTINRDTFALASPPRRTEMKGTTMGKTLITGGTVVTAADSFKADVLVDGEKVVAVGADLKAAGAKRIDASRKYVIPGGIDVHTHMELPFGGTMASDDFETGTVAAAFGGTTTIVDFAVQGFGEPLEKARDAWMKKARGKAVIDYGLHMIVRDVSDKVLREMGTMVKDGISSFKLFMAYPGVFMVDDGAIFKALVRSAEIGA